MKKYSDARYPEKINDLINNDGELSEEGKEIVGNSIELNAIGDYVDTTELVLAKRDGEDIWEGEISYSIDSGDSEEVVGKWQKIARDIFSKGKVKINFRYGSHLNDEYLNISRICDYRDDVEGPIHWFMAQGNFGCYVFSAGTGAFLVVNVTSAEKNEAPHGIDIRFRLHFVDPNG